ncbi:MAG: antibiotic biosynthesis monooxygenase family protein [Kineosporiaceae bacterium]
MTSASGPGPTAAEPGGIVEHAVITVAPGREREFEAVFAEARLVISAAAGCRWVQLARGVERPSVYVLLVGWDSVEAHVTGFRGSDRFLRWRELIGPYFATPPDVEHLRVVSP